MVSEYEPAGKTVLVAGLEGLFPEPDVLPPFLCILVSVAIVI